MLKWHKIQPPWQLIIPHIRIQNSLPFIFMLLLGYNIDSNYVLNDINNIKIFLAIISLVSVAFFATIQNDVEDYDIDNHQKRNTPLINMLVTVNQLQNFSLVLLFICLFAGILTKNLYFFVCILFLLTIFWQYNLKPIRASRKPFLSILFLEVAVIFAILSGYFLSNNYFSINLLLMLIGYFLLRSSISILKDYGDYKSDIKFNKQTFLIKFGSLTTKNVSIINALLGYILIFISIFLIKNPDLPYLLFILIIISILSIYLRLKIINTKDKYKLNENTFQAIFSLSILFDAGLILCLYI